METDQIIIEGTDVKEILKHNVPELEQSEDCALCKVIGKFAEYTIDLIKKGNLPIIKDCFNTAAQLMEAGSSEVRNLIENVYLFSVTTFMDMANAVSRQTKELLPPSLLSEYNRQIGNCNP